MKLKWGSAKEFDKVIYQKRMVEYKTLSEISTELGISSTTIHRRCVEMGIPTRVRTGNRSLETLKSMSAGELKDLYSKMTSFELGQMFGCDPSTVNHILKSKGLPRRQATGWLNLRLRVKTTTSHKFFAYKLINEGIDLRFDWINYPIMLSTNKIVFIDIAIPAIKLAIEIDGLSHLSDDGAKKDKERDELLKLHGWEVIHLNHLKAYLNAEETAKEIALLINSLYSKASETRAPDTQSMNTLGSDIVQSSEKSENRDKQLCN
jgi:hypothetical protein